MASSASDANHPPCPHCGAPLASPRAKQCLKCHFDWHDPSNIQQLVDPKWNRFGLNPDQTYVVELCQEPSGRRFTKYREVSEGVRNPFAVLETTHASGQMFIDWGFYHYAEHLALSNGHRFYFEAHGIWLTDDEVSYLDDDSDQVLASPPWVNGIPPNFPPK